MSKQIDLVIKEELNPIVAKATALIVSDNRSMTKAVEMLSQVNVYLDRITEEKEKVTKPANAILQAERKRWKPIEEICERAISTLRKTISNYQTEQTRIADEAKNKIISRVAPGKGNLSTETAVLKLESIETPPERITSDTGLVKFRTDKKFEIIDVSLIPREYMLPDEVMIRKAMKDGVELPGIRYWEEQTPINFR